MSQERSSPICGLLLSAVLAGACCLAGCAGSGKGTARLDFDPMIGGRPLAEKAEVASTKDKDRSEDPLLMPSGDASSSPAALAVTTRPERKEEKEKVQVSPPKIEEPQEKLTRTSADAPAKPAEGSYEQLQQQLEAKGVVWQNLKMTGQRGEWFFVCTIPDPLQNGVERQYEAKAMGSFGLAAIRAVLADIEADHLK